VYTYSTQYILTLHSIYLLYTVYTYSTQYILTQTVFVAFHQNSYQMKNLFFCVLQLSSDWIV